MEELCKNSFFCLGFDSVIQSNEYPNDLFDTVLFVVVEMSDKVSTL